MKVTLSDDGVRIELSERNLAHLLHSSKPLVSLSSDGAAVIVTAPGHAYPKHAFCQYTIRDKKGLK